jgi:hypothetical protein
MADKQLYTPFAAAGAENGDATGFAGDAPTD